MEYKKWISGGTLYPNRQTEISSEPMRGPEDTTDNQLPSGNLVNMVQGASEGDNPTNNPKNPSHIYNNFKEALIYSRLEDTKNMTLALELVVRKRHPRGKTIRYRTLEAVTIIHLAAQGIPTDPEELEQKIRGAYARRGLTLDLDQVCDEMRRTNGFVAFDSREPYPNCYSLRHC